MQIGFHLELLLYSLLDKICRNFKLGDIGINKLYCEKKMQILKSVFIEQIFDIRKQFIQNQIPHTVLRLQEWMKEV
jgi:hypothetical protein